MASIGVFDSGFGGLTVLKAFVRVLPAYDYIYLGDNGRAPYGDRSQERVYEFTKQAVAELFEQGCELVILACNTASSGALRRLQQEWLIKKFPDRRVLGILVPTAEMIAKNYADKKIGIIGTRLTIQSNAYIRELEKLISTKLRIEQCACPLLVPLIEEGWHDTIPGKMILKKYLRPLKNKQVDVLILACTHYALIKDAIVRIMGKRVAVIDTGSACAKALKTYLARHPEIEKKLSRTSSVRVFSTNGSSRIKNLCQRYWKSALPIECTELDTEQKSISVGSATLH